jgi:hypothetical protein
LQVKVKRKRKSKLKRIGGNGTINVRQKGRNGVDFTRYDGSTTLPINSEEPAPLCSPVNLKFKITTSTCLSMAAQTLSSPSKPRWNHNVFLSFRGEDTRKNFIDHLYTALVHAGIHTF